MGDPILLLTISFLFFITGLILLITGYYISHDVSQKMKSLHLPKGTVTYTDLHIPACPLFSQKNM